MAIHGQSLFRLNYPIKLYQWHHFCSSWNGKTGEWQLWVKAERVGRGFHNRVSAKCVLMNWLSRWMCKQYCYNVKRLVGKQKAVIMSHRFNDCAGMTNSTTVSFLLTSSNLCKQTRCANNALQKGNRKGEMLWPIYLAHRLDLIAWT